jgi:hypothetical protein
MQVTSNGRLYTCGANCRGQLGLGHTNDSFLPQLVRELDPHSRDRDSPPPPDAPPPHAYPMPYTEGDEAREGGEYAEGREGSRSEEQVQGGANTGAAVTGGGGGAFKAHMQGAEGEWEWGDGGGAGGCHALGGGGEGGQEDGGRCEGGGGVVEVACGEAHTLARMSDGSVWGFGSNRSRHPLPPPHTA